MYVDSIFPPQANGRARVLKSQMGDMVWNMLPGAHTLSTTRIADVRHVVRTGFANVYTLAGPQCSPNHSLCCLKDYNSEEHIAVAGSGAYRSARALC